MKNKFIKEYLMKEFSITEKQAQIEAERFSLHKDIENELIYYIQNKCLKEDPICVEGYTAKTLFEKGLTKTMYASYSILIYLRQKPDEALKSIKGGFKIK